MSRRTATKDLRKGDDDAAVLAETANPEAAAQERTVDDAEVVQDGRVLDFISGTAELKDTAKEQVRQRIARALFHEYGISVEDMEGDFSVRVGGRRRRVDIAICTFRRPAVSETLASLSRLIVPAGVRLGVIVADNDVEPSARSRVEAAMPRLRSHWCG